MQYFLAKAYVKQYGIHTVCHPGLSIYRHTESQKRDCLKKTNQIDMAFRPQSAKRLNYE